MGYNIGLPWGSRSAARVVKTNSEGCYDYRKDYYSVEEK